MRRLSRYRESPKGLRKQILAFATKDIATERSATEHNPTELIPLEHISTKYTSTAHTSIEHIYAERNGSPLQTQSQEGTAQSLCDRCKSLDWDAIFASVTSQEYVNDAIIPLANLEQLSSRTCSLCQLFELYCGDEWGVGLLCSVSWADTSGAGCRWSQQPPHLFDSRMLCILPSETLSDMPNFFRKRGYIAERRVDNPDTRKITPGPVELDVVDYTSIKQWLDYCQHQHSQRRLCSPLKVNRSWPLRLIDCETRKIIEKQNPSVDCPPFLALSYVWGRPTEHDRQHSSELPNKLPLTIEDSMIVTKKLGYRFLWVDRYCILQNNEEDKRQQTHFMAEIYGSAQATIVAASGSDPTHGLPGVSSTIRRYQPRVRIDKHFLAWTGRPADEISQSVWITRAWTYQEALLSTRLLVFTESQVYFQCGLMACCEAMHAPLDVENWVNHNAIVPRTTLGGSSSEMGERIHEYSQRNIGNNADILNGFQGILGNFANQANSVYNIWGVPMGDFDMDVLLLGLCWSLEKPGKRRKEFPSWAWAGWEGTIKVDYANTLSITMMRTIFDSDFIMLNEDLAVAFEIDGKRITWDRLNEPLRNFASSSGLRRAVKWTRSQLTVEPDQFKTLLIECSPISVKLLSYGNRTDSTSSDLVAHIGVVEMSQSTEQQHSWYPAGNFFPLQSTERSILELLPADSLGGILFGRKNSRTEELAPFILVVQRTGNVCTRVGHIECDEVLYWDIKQRLPRTKVWLRLA